MKYFVSLQRRDAMVAETYFELRNSGGTKGCKAPPMASRALQRSLLVALDCQEAGGLSDFYHSMSIQPRDGAQLCKQCLVEDITEPALLPCLMYISPLQAGVFIR